MKTVLKSIWLILVLGGISLWYWLQHGSWQTPGGTLLEHDAIRFGPIPILLGGCWMFLLLIALFLEGRSWLRTATAPRKSTKKFNNESPKANS